MCSAKQNYLQAPLIHVPSQCSIPILFFPMLGHSHFSLLERGYDDDDDKLIYAIEPLRSVRFLWENGTYCQEGRSALGVLKGRLSA